MPLRKLILGTLATLLVLALTAVGVVLARTGRPKTAPLKAAPPKASAETGRPEVQTESITCRSQALGGTLPVEVYLPPEYGARHRRYPVIYFLHGLPAGPQAYTQTRFVADALASNGLRAIVVAPQGARTADSDREYLDWSPTEDWPRAISHDLTTCVDRRFHTIAARDGRALIGLSAGGYGALNVGLRNLQTFAAVESWSGYFAATDPSGYDVLQFPTRAAQAAATVPSGSALKRALGRWPTLLAFYVGISDDRFADTNQAFDGTLRAHRIGHVFRMYPGGHSGALWQAHAPTWLGLALRYLARLR